MSARSNDIILSVGDLSDQVDAVSGERNIRLMIGAAFASRRAVSLTTVLGSCVAVCLYDPVAGVGGMNHFMLPVNSRDTVPPRDLRFGCDALPWLVQAVLDLGARSGQLQAKVFGGGAAMGRKTRIGYGNIEYARAQLEASGIPILAEDVGKTVSRQIRFETATGRVYVRYLTPGLDEAVLQEESSQIAGLAGGVGRP